MTGAELITYVRAQTLLDTSDVSDATVLTHLNRAIELVGGRFDWPFLEGSDTIATVVGQQEYTWPTGAVKIDTITIDGKRVRLRRIDSTEAWGRYGDDPPTTEPRAFYLWGGKIVLAQKPPEIITLNVYFHKQPTVLASTSSSPEWNTQYHRFLADYAISKLWEREEDRAQAADAYAAFEGGINELASFYNDQADNERMVWGEQPDKHVGSSQANMPWLDGV